MTQRPDLGGLMPTLVDAGVEFVVCGGVAVVLHGVERVTMDLDIRVPEDEANTRRLVECLLGRGFVPRNPEPMSALCDPARRKAWVEEKSALVWELRRARQAGMAHDPVPKDSQRESRQGDHDGSESTPTGSPEIPHRSSPCVRTRRSLLFPCLLAPLPGKSPQSILRAPERS